MDIFVSGSVNPQAFEMDVRRGTHDLSDVLAAATQTQSARIESTHFLIALARMPGGATQKHLARLGMTVAQWEGGLSNCALRSPDDLPPAYLTEENFHENAVTMLLAARDYCQAHGLPRISEAVLLLSALQNLTAKVRKLFESADIDVKAWREAIEKSFKPAVPLPVFKSQEPYSLITDSFSPGGRKILGLIKSETESLGYSVSDPRHLLLALLEYEGGATQYGIYHQGLMPRKIQEAVMLNLKNRAKRTRSSIAMERDYYQPILQRIILLSGELAGSDHVERIAEPHLLRAFLAIDSTAKRILEDENVNIAHLREIAEEYEITAEEEDDSAMADIETVRKRLQARLVGQDEAIKRILPYIQRMRFGFTAPGRPVGVFLFCGQSGSGKTEMAKELARAVYGSEESLIFLEMGQFNSPESMNIFVGAPPGYVGYGEGKLTNGLRDKPRAVILFDEMEKAHSKVLDALLRFLDEGKIDDPAGPIRDGSQCIVILTSNVGSDMLSTLWEQFENNPNWRTEIRKILREEFKKREVRPEFLNRVDELILFCTLREENYTEIARRLLERDLKRLHKEHGIEVLPDPDLAREIGRYCAQVGEGARAAQRLTQTVVITPVIEFVLKNSYTPPLKLKVRAERVVRGDEGEPVGIISRA